MMVLLDIASHAGTSAPKIAARLEAARGRAISRGALYATLDRLEQKKLITWRTAATSPADRRVPKRRFALTSAGEASLRRAHEEMTATTRSLAKALECL